MTSRRTMLTAALAALALPVVSACAGRGSRESTGEYIDDATITTRVKAALIDDPQVKAREVNVETSRGVVQLSGFVAQSSDAERAVEIARKVPGVKSVRNDIRVKPAS
uniref:BON domain-containing protein n=2 Tax=Aromatoleum buckelii TaxID=200254 RepID=A0ABX1N287_9RHOO